MVCMIRNWTPTVFGQNRGVRCTAAAAMITIVCGMPLLFAQNPPAAPPDLARGQRVYADHCVGCHGADFRGTDQGPELAGNAVVRGMSLQRLRGIVKGGIPSTGMPAFDLPAQEVDALALLVRSLNSEAAQ